MSGFAFVDDDGNRVPDEDAYGRLWMRDRQNHWWRDLGMQDAGWTYEFFDGSLLMRDDVSFAGGLVQPDGPGYQALIVYQSELDPDVAAHLLDWAREGLKIVVVHGTRELKLLLAGSTRPTSGPPPGRRVWTGGTTSSRRPWPRCSRCPRCGGRRSGQTPDRAPLPRRTGRAEFVGDNRSVLTHLREDGDLLHLYLYHFLYETGEPTQVEVALPGAGAVYRIDGWTGALRPHPGVRRKGTGRSSPSPWHPGRRRCSPSTAPPRRLRVPPASSETVAELAEWTIAVESWDAGELRGDQRGPRTRLRDP